MFAAIPIDDLRQGDVLEKVWFTPATFHKIKDEQITVPQPTIRRAHLVVVSHCCELTWFTNEQGQPQPRRPYVLVAPLSLKMPFSRESDEYRMLIENGVNKPENDPVQFFYYQDNTAIGSEAVIDFSAMIPIRSALLRSLGLKKLLQLDVKHRHLFRTKLHEYFSRIPEEEWDEVRRLFPEESP